MKLTEASSPAPQKKTMPCHKRKAAGAVCTATATVEREDRVYESRVSWERGGTFERVLLETRYFLNCPTCGAWERVTKAKPSEGIRRADAS